MADIQMTQIDRTTHHYRALIDVDPANLTPTVDLLEFIGRNTQGSLATLRMVDAIISDPGLEETIEAEFEAQTTSVKGCEFVADSLIRVVNFAGMLMELTITLDITTVALLPEAGALEMKFEFLHTIAR